jgi:DNA helicase-2/ATP-dependent DNA helicase PcrA
MCVTYTNKAAKEMQTRVASLIGIKNQDLTSAWINTFHSLSLRLLIENGNYKLVGLKDKFHILDTEDQERQIKELLKFDSSSKKVLMDIFQ